MGWSELGLKRWRSEIKWFSNPQYLVYFKCLALMVAIVISLCIATQTTFNAHPDEFIHVDAFRYFQGRWFPPEVGSDQVAYSSYGNSRVYAQELVYILYGNLANLGKTVLGIQPNYLTYRLFNVGLFGITLSSLLFAKLKNFRLDWLGYAILCTPQIYYLYSYANSDAWALSVSLFLFIIAVKIYQQSVENSTVKDFLLLGILTGLLLVAKKNFYLGLFLPYSLIGFSTIHWLTKIRFQWVQLQRCLLPLFAWLISACLIMAPLQIIYPLSQGDFQAKILQTQEAKAKAEYKPSNATFKYLRMGEKGYSYWDIAFRKRWLKFSTRSFWGLYGYMNLRNPHWVYDVVFYCTIGLLSLTGLTLVQTQAWQDLFLAICLPISVVVIGLNVFVSLHHSLTVDLQAQGRYLFPSFIPVALWLTGATAPDRYPAKAIRRLIFIILYGLTLCSLIFVCLPRLSIG
ncbi:DUF2142 domain-containing protein [Pantanalinema sp. GBBB05]|uniref:DUF2142 domain-containing protein n=1 Tax=Pantanalinema sp. GBBB05 TaxID=2604139 RepID=UPI001DE20AB4|nr:hypothetical protein [Pantanalinema sp. GBBB05]